MKITITNTMTFLRDKSLPQDKIDSLKTQTWIRNINLFSKPYLGIVVEYNHNYTYDETSDKQNKPGFL